MRAWTITKSSFKRPDWILHREIPANPPPHHCQLNQISTYNRMWPRPLLPPFTCTIVHHYFLSNSGPLGNKMAAFSLAWQASTPQVLRVWNSGVRKTGGESTVLGCVNRKKKLNNPGWNGTENGNRTHTLGIVHAHQGREERNAMLGHRSIVLLSWDGCGVRELHQFPEVFSSLTGSPWVQTEGCPARLNRHISHQWILNSLPFSLAGRHDDPG